MNNAELYHRANDVQRYDAEQIIIEYSANIKWLPNGGDSLIDLGSGSGDVLMDFIYPRMPCNFQMLVCSDINDKMIDYVQRQFGHIKVLEFKVFDMGTETDQLPNDLRGQFHHVLSFYALKYLKSQRYVI